jgi:hypothetical protein
LTVISHSTAYQVVRVPGPGEEMPATASDANNPSVILHEQQNGFQEHSSRSSSPREPISATVSIEFGTCFWCSYLDFLVFLILISDNICFWNKFYLRHN